MHILYLPYAIISTIIFTCANAILAPIAGVAQIFRMVKSLTSIRNNKARMARMISILKFMIAAPAFFTIQVFLEIFIYFVYLYKVPSQI